MTARRSPPRCRRLDQALGPARFHRPPAAGGDEGDPHPRCHSFVIDLAQPFGHVIEALGKPSVHVPFVMPARIANATPPTQAVKEVIGSGPFLFLKDEWVPGEKTYFRRNPAYRPREEAADGLAGGKRPLVERVEFVTMPDVSLRAAALDAGRGGLPGIRPFDYLPRFTKDRNLVISQAGGISQIMGGVSINHYLPPFNNVVMRRAVQAALDRSEIVAAHGLPADMTSPDCISVYMCGTTYTNDAGGRHHPPPASTAPAPC